jgi:hypothetical protein
MGGIWDYYHFLIDWSAPVLFLLKDAGTSITLHAPCYAAGSDKNGFTFMFDENSTISKMRQSVAVWNRMWAYRNQQVTVLREAVPSPKLEALQWHLRENHQEWSMSYPAVYKHFREFWWEASARTFAEPVPNFNKDEYILIVFRTSSRRAESEATFQNHLDTDELSNVRYEAVDLVTKTQEEQVRLFANARAVVGMHGAGLSNIVFQRPGSLVIEMGYREYPCFENLARRAGLDYKYEPNPAAVMHVLEEFAKPALASPRKPSSP